MSQRECSGLNGAPTTVPAGEPVRISPDAVRRIGPGRVGAIDQSTSLTVLRLASVLPAALDAAVAGEPAMAVGHPASQTCRPSSALIGTARHSDPSLWCRVAISNKFSYSFPVQNDVDTRQVKAVGAYSEKARPYLDAIAEGVFGSVHIRDWILQGTPHEATYRGADILIEEQRAVRWNTKRTKQPFWANYWCGKDSRCTCRTEGSKGLESDAIFFFRNGAGRVLAVHVEFKHPAEAFQFGQAEAYPLRAACFARTHAQRKKVNAHQDWATVLFCGSDALSDPRIKNFQRVITHAEAGQKLPNYPSSVI